MLNERYLYSLLALVIAATTLKAASSANIDSPPNIVLILADQLRFDASHSSSAHRTPNLDQFAARGACFLSAYSSTPTCTPARAALLTGQSPWHHGMLGYGKIAPKYPRDLSVLLRDQAGYETVVIGKNHFGWNKTKGIAHGYESMELYEGLTETPDDYLAFFKSKLPNDDPMATGLGWNDWESRPYVFDEEMHPTTWTGRETLAYIQNRSKHQNEQRPFFLKLSFHRPHSPYDPPQRWLDQVNVSGLTPPAVGGNWDAVFNATECGGKDAWCGSFDMEAVMRTRAAYLANIMMVDDWVGRIHDTILAQYPNTYFILTSDHGDMQGDHNLWRKGYPYEGSSHIPMLVEWPKGASIPEDRRGARLENVVELRDLLPTIAHIAGVNLSETLKANDGQSMLCLIELSSGDDDDSLCAWRPFLDLEHTVVYNQTIHWNALTDGRQKYIFRAFFGDEQLFDLTRDPNELDNLADDPSYRFDLELWRSRMVEQFRLERRGSRWVTDEGDLQRRPKGQLYSPNYPQMRKTSLGSSV